MKIGFKFAFKGFARLCKSEKNFRVHLLLFSLLVICSFLLGISKIEWLIILGLSALVISMEALNSALEKLCDKVEPKKSEEIAWIKDVAAAAVFVAALFSFVCAIIIFLPYIVDLNLKFGAQYNAIL